MYLWRAIDQEGEVLDYLVQSKRNMRAALKLMRKLLKSQNIAPKTIVTDQWKAYAAAFRKMGLVGRHHQAKWKNNFIEGHTHGSESENEPCRTSGHLALPNDSSRSTRLTTIILTPEGT
jgi:transposase-like protein